MIKHKISFNNFIFQIIESDLLNGKHKNIHTRFPPEPNGYLHIGHAKSICLNFGIAKHFQGKCNLRFDDTNPTKENTHFIESIQEDIKWLGFSWHGNVRYSSDYFEELYKYAIELIEANLAYVDELTPEKIREYRGTLTTPGKNSPYRNRTIQENIILFKKMRNGEFNEGQACLRAKIDMTSSYVIMRDPVLYRIRYIKHHQTGDKWCIYPMYDFAHCISDAIEGITHSLCTLEFQDNRRLYDWILKHISITKCPKQYEFSRLNLEYAVMSKRKLNQLVERKYVEGWDDPRMLTISGLRRRGYTAASIREFCYRIGVTKQNNIVEKSLLESCIRNDLNKIAPRAMAVLNPIQIIINNLPDDYYEIMTMPNHPNNITMGSRTVPFSKYLWIDRYDFQEVAKNKFFKRLVLGGQVRLRNAYIIRAESIEKDNVGNVVCIYCTCNLDTLHKHPIDGKKIKGIIHWVSIKHAQPAEFRIYDNLFDISNPGLENNFLDAFNKKSLKIKKGYVEPNLKKAIATKPYQFEREGYFCADPCLSKPSHLVFNQIVNLRDTLKKLS
ncbi:MAG: glutamine--tRNA ligase [Pantoea sp. Brub]|nr:glutamine--tRNA ligase [Pantoea sp. Brub]